jgi:hypothetical protein
MLCAGIVYGSKTVSFVAVRGASQLGPSWGGGQGTHDSGDTTEEHRRGLREEEMEQGGR